LGRETILQANQSNLEAKKVIQKDPRNVHRLDKYNEKMPAFFPLAVSALLVLVPLLFPPALFGASMLGAD
jgi:hypothetical protein